MSARGPDRRGTFAEFWSCFSPSAVGLSTTASSRLGEETVSLREGQLVVFGALSAWFYQHKDSDRLIKLCKAVTEWFVFSCPSGGGKQG